MPTYQDRLRAADRRRAIAEALIAGGSAPQGQMAGRFFSGPTNTSALAGLAGIIGGRVLNRRADREEQAATDEERSRLVAALQRLTGGDPGVDGGAINPQQQAALDVVGNLPIEQQQQLVAGQSLERLFPKPQEGFTLPEGGARYDASGKLIAERTKPDAQTTDQRNYAAAYPNNDYPGGFGQWLADQKRAGASSVNVNTERNLYGTMAEKQGAANVELYSQAQKAPELLARAQRVKAALGPGSQAITGAGAEQLLGLAKVAAQLGFNTGDAAADTEALARDLAASTLDQIKASGLGAGSGFSNADRDFLEKVVGGKITLEAATLQRLADLNEKSALGTIERWNATASRLKPEQLRDLGMSPIEMPAGSRPPAAAPKLQRNPDGSYTYSP
jgi:hypothetical protein